MINSYIIYTDLIYRSYKNVQKITDNHLYVVIYLVAMNSTI